MSESSKVQRVSLIKMNCLPQRPLILPMATDITEKKNKFYNLYLLCFSQKGTIAIKVHLKCLIIFDNTKILL